LDGALPAVLDDELLGQPAPLGERLLLEPAVDLLRRLAERGILQRLERSETATVVLQRFAQLIEMRGDARLLLAELLDLRPGRFEGTVRVLTRRAQPLLL